MNHRRNRRNQERRQRFLGVLLKLTIVAGAAGMIAYYAYEVGFRVAAGEVSGLKGQLKESLDKVQVLQDQAETDHAMLAEAKKQAEDFRGLYEQERPTDAMKDLSSVVRAKLAEGMDAHRLAFVIRSAKNPHDCEMLGTKRFLVRTPRYRGPAASTMVRYDEVVTISADGDGANGGHEQWFDADRPVRVSLSAAGARTAELQGTLPIEHAVAVHNSEYHFTIGAASARGWVEVVTERCNFR